MNLSTFLQQAAKTCSLLLFMLFSTNAFSIEVNIVYLEVQIGDTLEYEFHADCSPNPPEIEYHTISPVYGNAFIDAGNGGGPAHYGGCFDGLHKIEYIPTINNVNRDIMYVRYTVVDQATNLNVEHFDILIIDIINSSINAKDDYAFTAINTPVTIDVLFNDVSDFDISNISFVALNNHGRAEIINDQLVFTPETGFTGVAKVEYTACTEDGSCDIATVFIGVDDDTADEEINYQVYDNRLLNIYDNLQDYDVDLGPLNGILETDADGFYIYLPNVNNPSGDFTETIVFEHQITGVTKEFIIEVIANYNPNVYTKEDNIWVCENDYVTFIPTANDLLPYMSTAIVVDPIYGEENYIGNSLFEYEVYADTEATKKDAAVYRAAAFNWAKIEYQKINININEFAPNESTYKLKTKSGVPLVLEYKTKLSNPVELDISNTQLIHGDTLVYVGDTFTWNGETCTGEEMVVYFPSTSMNSYVDTFDLYYHPLPGGNNEYKIKIEVEVVDDMANAGNDCIGENCVWPGDMDNNGVVDSRDVLLLAYGIGSVGDARPNGTSQWIGQYAPSWDAPVYGTPIDYKYLDANADGRIDSTDLEVIDSNFGLENNIYPSRIYGIGNVNVDAAYGNGSTMLENTPLAFPPLTPITGPLSEGDVFLLDILLGGREKAAEDIHGLSFTMAYSTILTDSNNIRPIFHDNSWFTQNSSVIEFYKSPVNGFLDIAYSRTRSRSGTGHGSIGVVEFIIITDIGGIKTDKSELVFTADDITIMDGEGNVKHYPPYQVSVPINTGNTEHIAPKLLAYPNPTEGMFNLHLNGGMDKLIDSYEIYSIDGKVVSAAASLNTKSQVVDLSSNPAGIYMVKVITTTGVVLNQKIEIVQ